MTAAHGPGVAVAAVLVAGGSGTRLGADRPKAFVTIAGATLLGHAAARVTAHPSIGRLVVVVPADRLDEATSATEAAAAAAGVAATVVAGGDTRQASVAAGLAALDGEVEFVLVHDAARPFVPAAVFDAVLAALHGGADAVVPVLPIADTVRRVEPDGSLAEVLDRSRLVAVQTPQGFRRAVLVRAHAVGAGLAATDDAGLVEAVGGRVVAVPGAEESFKITTPADLARAEAIARALGSAPNRSLPVGSQRGKT